MTMMEDDRTPVLEADVLTADRERLGTVKEIEGNCFKIDAPMARDYWLASDTISEVVQGEEIILRYRRDEIDNVKMDSPDEHTGLHKHAA